MPSLNQAEFIEVAVRSVLQQSYPALELLISDGVSSDGTLSVLERLSIEFGARLRWISSADEGPAHALNKALRSAQGDIIGWLNADDIYAPDAVSVAVQRFAAEAEMVMVYGEGEHVDGSGRTVGRYPTLAPAAGIESFQEGCFICQPTVFLRRRVFDEISGLNEELSTAFDFDLWLRLFLRFPGRIGYIERVQAFSRVHGRTITSLQRKTVASEGIQLLSRYLGRANIHWILTYIDEATRAYPVYDTSLDLREHVSAMLAELGPCFEAQELVRLRSLIEQDRRITDVPKGIHVDMFPDGWAGRELAVRIRSPLAGSFSLLLQCENRPATTPLTLTIGTNCGTQTHLDVTRRGQFEIRIPFSDIALDQLLFASVRSTVTFVPKLTERGSSDIRELSFHISRVSLKSTHR